MNGSPCSVAVAPHGYRDADPGCVIGAGFDGSPEAEDALDAAAELARRAGATRVISAVPPVNYG